MPSRGMLRRVALARTDVSEEHIASIIRVKGISELGTTLAVTSNRRTLRRNAILVTLISLLVCCLKTYKYERNYNVDSNSVWPRNVLCD
jgi:hypothetical protein